MDNNSFLNKFKGRTEIVGKEGLIGVMNNLHNNIIGYEQKQKINTPLKFKRNKILDNEYSYIESIVKDEFNKNINFIPQLKSSIISNKVPDNIESQKIINNNSNIINITNKNEKQNYGINSGIKNNIKKFNYKSLENPKRLFKLVDNAYMGQNGVINKENLNIKSCILKKNKNKKLPIIVSHGINKEKNNLNKNNILKVNKSYEKNNTFNINLKKQILNQNLYHKNNEDLAEKNIDKKYKKLNTFKEENLNKNKLSELYIKRNFSEIFSSRNILRQKSSIENIEKTYNNILNKIKKDFTLLDTLKDKINKIQKNNSFINEYKYRENLNKNNYELKNNNNNNINNINNINTYNNKNNSKNLNINMNNIKDNMKNINNHNQYNNNNNNIINASDLNKNKIEEQKENYLNNCSDNYKKFDIKLEVINEEEDDKNTTNINNIENEKKQNYLEVLMNQRLYYQNNKIPDNSRFKLNQFNNIIDI